MCWTATTGDLGRTVQCRLWVSDAITAGQPKDRGSLPRNTLLPSLLLPGKAALSWMKGQNKAVGPRQLGVKGSCWTIIRVTHSKILFYWTWGLEALDFFIRDIFRPPHGLLSDTSPCFEKWGPPSLNSFSLRYTVEGESFPLGNYLSTHFKNCSGGTHIWF